MIQSYDGWGADMAAEKQFENKIKKFLESRGAWFVKYWAGAQYTKSGIPDILACINGRFFGIEVKAQSGRPSEIQMYNIRKINDAGGIGIVLYPSKYEEFTAFVDALLDDVPTRREIPEIWR